jgi:hypothetical protein
MKTKRARKDTRGPLQRLYDSENAVGAGDTQPNAFMEAHGLYARNLRFVQNNGCSTVKRWETAKLLTPGQLAAIAHMIRLWAAAFETRGLVVDLDRVRGGMGGGDGMRQQEAIDDLKRIEAQFPHAYFTVFETSCASMSRADIRARGSRNGRGAAPSAC